MKIGILTHYQVHNHGAILQMYGLYYTLKSLDYTPYILTYEKNFDFIFNFTVFIFSFKFTGVWQLEKRKLETGI